MARPVKHIWNEAQSQRIEKLAMIGVNDEHIAPIEKMSQDTLRRLYRKELTDGRAKGIGAVSQTLYQMALSGKNPAATFFFMKCRAHWREVHSIEHSGPEGKQIPIKTEHTILSTDQIKRIAEETLKDIESK